MLPSKLDSFQAWWWGRGSCKQVSSDILFRMFLIIFTDTWFISKIILLCCARKVRAKFSRKYHNKVIATDVYENQNFLTFPITPGFKTTKVHRPQIKPRVWQQVASKIGKFDILIHDYRSTIPSISKNAKMSARSDYDKSFKVRAAQLWNLVPGGIGDLRIASKFDSANSWSSTPPVTGYMSANNNSLLSWR